MIPVRTVSTIKPMSGNRPGKGFAVKQALVDGELVDDPGDPKPFQVYSTSMSSITSNSIVSYSEESGDPFVYEL